MYKLTRVNGVSVCLEADGPGLCSVFQKLFDLVPVVFQVVYKLTDLVPVVFQVVYKLTVQADPVAVVCFRLCTS